MALALASPLALQAASMVAKQAFGQVSSRSMKGLTQAITERFQGNSELLRLRDQLELKLAVLSLPLEICIQKVIHGSSALQASLEEVVSVIQEVEALEEQLCNQAITLARGETSPSRISSPVQTSARLQGLIQRLDSIIPYLSLSISSVAIAETGESELSPSRLMQASNRLMAAASDSGKEILRLPRVAWHSQTVAMASGKGTCPMQTSFLLCSLALQRLPQPLPAEPPGEEPEVSSAHAAKPEDFCYSLRVQQDLEDGTYHDDDEAPGKVGVDLASLQSVSWSTMHSLNLGDNDHSPVLLLVVDSSRPPAVHNRPSVLMQSSLSASSTATPGSRTPAPSDFSQQEPRTPEQQRKLMRYGIQCSTATQEEEGRDTSSSLQDTGITSWQTLAELEYLLRLCLLELQEGVRHYQVSDERIRMAFSQAPADSPPSRKHVASMSFARGRSGLGSASMTRSDRSTTILSRQLSRSELAEDGDETSSVARDLGRMDLGFGSPVMLPHDRA
ncbi:hypothetical protein WJX74_009569 [Apatococcus lobatus]|uniref:Uncharacterized protein n=1 Tax=Apatococcus lobatus TaxID=904363 RepID=A0AAW1QJG0_9CHLO